MTSARAGRKPWAMSSNAAPPKDKAAEREAKLAQALRANLRRRKLDGARPPPGPPPAPDGESG